MWERHRQQRARLVRYKEREGGSKVVGGYLVERNEHCKARLCARCGCRGVKGECGDGSWEM